MNGGFNRGVDFKSGLALQFQVAPASFSDPLHGRQARRRSPIPAGEQALTAAGDFIITRHRRSTARRPTRRSAGPTTRRSRPSPRRWPQVPGIDDRDQGRRGRRAPASSCRSCARGHHRRRAVHAQPDAHARAGACRRASRTCARPSTPLGKHDLQVVGAVENQEFIARFEATADTAQFQTEMEAKVLAALRAAYGDDQVILKRTDFVGPRLAQQLGSQAIWLIVIALVAILVYMAFRFPFVYGVAAVGALVHDALDHARLRGGLPGRDRRGDHRGHPDHPRLLDQRHDRHLRPGAREPEPDAGVEPRDAARRERHPDPRAGRSSPRAPP